MEHTYNHQDATSKMKGHAGTLEAWLAPIFAKAPHLPHGWIKFITDIAPWLSIIFGVLVLIGLVGAGLLGALLSPFALLAGGFSGIAFFITIILGIIGALLSIFSFNPLRAMKKKGWNYAFYSLVISAISWIINILLAIGGLGGVVGLILGVYVLFEIRGRYN